MNTILDLTPVERDSVLAGLRLLQMFNDNLAVVTVAGAHDEIECIRGYSGQSLTNTQIDALCMELNV